MPPHRFAIAVSAICLLTAGSGCKKFVPVEGRVTFDGKPLGGACVMFHPVNVVPGDKGGPTQANATADEHGVFRLKSVNEVGAWPGDYKVSISKRFLPDDAPVPGRFGTPHPKDADPKTIPNLQMGTNINLGDYMKELLPEIYLSEKTTPLSFTVPKGGTKEANFDLKSKQP